MSKEEIFEAIEEASAAEIDEYLDAALNRKRELYPDWDICYLALPNNAPKQRKELLEALKVCWK